jgi:hypothetical protein
MKKAYTASSLKQAIEKIQDTYGVLIEKPGIALLMCPIVGERPFNSKEPCLGYPKGCQRAHFQNCQRAVKIYVNDNVRFCWMILARFTISNTNDDGYVERNDRALRWLIDDKKLINESDLVPIEV